MKFTTILGILTTVFVVINVELSFSYKIVQSGDPGQRKVTWAKVLDSSSESKTLENPSRTQPQSLHASSRVGLLPVDNKAVRRERIQKYRPNRDSLRQANTDTATASAPNNGFQKRALDLLYHKFVEPRIHKNIESRPSLIEELIQTFESHVQKDLAAWSRATPHSYGGNAIQGSSAPKPDHTYPDVKKPIEQITSVADVEQGENEDTFVVTDETGVTHVVSVDDIINSLAQMDEKEISKLLIGTPIEPIGTPIAPIEPVEKIERRSSSVINGDQYGPQEIKSVEDLSLKQNTIQIPVKRHVPEKVEYDPFVDENEVILIKSEDGDTRLVTRKDVMLAAVASEKKASTANQHSPKEVLTSTTVNKNNDPINNLNINTKSQFLSLEDIAKLHVASDHPIYIHPSEPSKRSPAIENNSVNSHFQQLSTPTNSPAELSGLESIRESLAEMRRQQQKEKEVLLPSAIPPTFQNTAPNSPPVQILNSPSPGTDSYLRQSPITIQQLQPHTRLSSDSGIRDRFSNFFSRLIGKKVNNVDISHRPKGESDQYVQVVMPNPNSDGMEQVTIPLPKPIHYETRHTRSTTSVARRGEPTPTDRRSSYPTRPDTFHSRSDSVYAEEPIDAETAQLILNSAKVPKSIHKSILAQINDKPKYEIPGLPVKEKNAHPTYQAQAEDNTERKDKFSHVGYTYDLSPLTIDDSYYGGGYVYAPAPQYGAHHSPPAYGGHGASHSKPVVIEQELYEEDQPLLDINLLADLKYLSKVGYQDESFSFPRVGDGSKFVDTRQKYYY